MRTRSLFLPLSFLFAAGCSRAPVQSFEMQGFRDARVVFVADSGLVALRDEIPALQGKPWVHEGERNPQAALRAVTGKLLASWGRNCKSHFVPKSGSYDPRMGLVRASDGWNVGDQQVLRSYTRSTGTDYLVVLNRLVVNRSELERSGAGAVGRQAYADVLLDISVIDAKVGKRVWRSPSQARTERSDSLELLVPQTIDLAVDNFFVALPAVRRWGCEETAERFQ